MYILLILTLVLALIHAIRKLLESYLPKFTVSRNGAIQVEQMYIDNHNKLLLLKYNNHMYLTLVSKNHSLLLDKFADEALIQVK